MKEPKPCVFGHTGLRTGGIKECVNRTPLERGAIEGKSPVGKNADREAGIQSTTGHEESRGKLGGPPPKAKYYPVTDRV